MWILAPQDPGYVSHLAGAVVLIGMFYCYCYENCHSQDGAGDDGAGGGDNDGDSDDMMTEDTDDGRATDASKSGSSTLMNFYSV